MAVAGSSPKTTAVHKGVQSQAGSREGVGGACLLKGQDRPLHSHLFFIIKRQKVRHNRLKDLGMVNSQDCFLLICGHLLGGGNLRKLGTGHILA